MRTVLMLLFCATACGVAEEEVRQTPARPLRAPEALTDSDPSPDVVEVWIVAAEGTAQYLDRATADVWGYRDGARADSTPSVPGPFLRAKRGDLIVAHVKNDLSVPTTVHWHGLRLPAIADGSTATQNPIPPGESFEYRFVANDAGTFWYHPHVNADRQIEAGLQAAFIVDESDGIDVAADRLMILDDVKLNADGRLSEETDALDQMLGRQGNVLLVNGQKEPQIAVAPGSRERWRLINAANGRYFNLRLRGHRFKVIAWDGGLLPEPYDREQLLIAPGERYEVLVEISPDGGDLWLETVHYDRGHDVPDAGPKRLMQLMAGESGRPGAPLPNVMRQLTPLPIDQGTFVRPFVLRETEDGPDPLFFINDESWPFNTPVMVKQGELEIWEIDNRTEMDHPFHLHGMFFEVLGERLGWKDTVNVPKQSKLRFAVRYDPLGMWMFHCHILEHAERGMMGELMVMEEL